MNDEKADVVVNAGPREGIPTANRDGFASAQSGASLRPADAWLFIEVLRQRWLFVLFGGLICAGLGFAAAAYVWKPGFIASARLIRNESPRTAEVFTYQTLTPETFVSLLRSPELLNHVAGLADPPVPTDRFAKRVRLTPERDGDVVAVEVFGPTKQAAMAMANLYADEAIRFTQKLQSNAANEVREFVGPQIVQIESEIAELKNTKLTVPKALPAAVGSRPSPLKIKRDKAREELVDALTKYTETHPIVQSARATVEALEAQIANGAELPAPPSDVEVAGHIALQRDAWDMLRSELQPLEGTRHQLIKRHRAAQLVAADPPGYYEILSPSLLRDVKGTKREIKIGAVTIFFGIAGVIGFALLALLTEVMDNRIKAPADVTRVTGLPVIAGAPDLDKLTQGERRNWAFRTWKTLQGRLSPNLNHGLVCGLTSAGGGEGRSTWIRHLARAASECGFRVLTVSTRQQGQNGYPNGHANGGANGHVNGTKTKPGPGANGQAAPAPAPMNRLPSPVEVENKLAQINAEPVVHIPLPGWVWNLERRKQWQSALEQWRKIDNVVILVELPPASMPEAVLLAEEIPNVIWLSDSGTSSAVDTRTYLETLRHARCNLVGAVLNHAPFERVRRRFARWMPCLLLTFAWNICSAQQEPLMVAAANTEPASQPAAATSTELAQADTTAPRPTTTGSFLGGTAPNARAPWQERLTLGAGDMLRIALYGSPELTRSDIVVAPDGRVGFLEAQDVMAAGRTIDEFRRALDEALAAYRRAPRTMVTPMAFNSKKYCVLGKVNQRGVYTLQHPTTVLEAIARAQGFEVGLRERDSIHLVDLHRSFLMRDGQRVPLDFERMFLDGDLSQNVALAPGDFLFFPPTGIQEIHVLGDVRFPGSVTYAEDLGAIGAISQRAGFNEKSYKSRVLVVRGSLENPQTFVVDCNAILKGEAQDFKLQPQDIVYVARRPWWRAEELLDTAITAFLQSVVASYVGQDVIKPFDP